MHIHNCIQQSEEWFSIRKGRPTASQFKKIITPAKGELSKQASGYIIELIAECFCPTYAAFIGNNWTDRGNELEPEARKAFEDHTGLFVEQVGFVTQGDNGAWKHAVGCSPDGLLKDDSGEYVAGLEIKCPSPATHVEYVLNGVLPDEYKPQVHGSLAVTGLPRWHFWSYYPGMQPLHVIVERDAYTDKLTAALDKFLIDYGAAREKAIPKLQIL